MAPVASVAEQPAPLDEMDALPAADPVSSIQGKAKNKVADDIPTLINRLADGILSGIRKVLETDSRFRVELIRYLVDETEDALPRIPLDFVVFLQHRQGKD